MRALTNFSAGHETRVRLVGPARLDYPDNHIEVDNRLSWMLGGLSAAHDPEETLYVHLTRDSEATDFADVLSRIRAEGDIVAAIAEWDHRHNASATN